MGGTGIREEDCKVLALSHILGPRYLLPQWKSNSMNATGLWMR